MQISVYQLQVSSFENGRRIEKKDRKCFFNKIGVVTGEGESIDPELIWRLTNHSCWKCEENAAPPMKSMAPLFPKAASTSRPSMTAGTLMMILCSALTGSGGAPTHAAGPE